MAVQYSWSAFLGGCILALNFLKLLRDSMVAFGQEYQFCSQGEVVVGMIHSPLTLLATHIIGEPESMIADRKRFSDRLPKTRWYPTEAAPEL